MKRNIEFTKYPRVLEFTTNKKVYASIEQIITDLKSKGIEKTPPTIEKKIKEYNVDAVRAGKAVFYNKIKAMKVLSFEYISDLERDNLRKQLEEDI